MLTAKFKASFLSLLDTLSIQNLTVSGRGGKPTESILLEQSAHFLNTVRIIAEKKVICRGKVKK